MSGAEVGENRNTIFCHTIVGQATAGAGDTEVCQVVQDDGETISIIYPHM